ncbi:hypothetical protein ACF9IK_01360 [Kitasatospora hibisci]|uniref:hypothetical protein n=1 Tax=Kitasatospora hibisci TaxID=3369522 RepID=UPI003754EB54
MRGATARVLDAGERDGRAPGRERRGGRARALGQLVEASVVPGEAGRRGGDPDRDARAPAQRGEEVLAQRAVGGVGLEAVVEAFLGAGAGRCRFGQAAAGVAGSQILRLEVVQVEGEVAAADPAQGAPGVCGVLDAGDAVNLGGGGEYGRFRAATNDQVSPGLSITAGSMPWRVREGWGRGGGGTVGGRG